YWLQAAGQTDLLGRVLVLVLVREIAPLVAGVIVVGRSGIPMLIRLDELRTSGQLRMLAAQGIDPLLLLVVPRVMAFAFSAFCLTMVLLTTALLIGYFTGHAVGAVKISLYTFFDTLLKAMGPAEYLLLPVKSLAIGFVVGIASGLPVLTADGTSDVGKLSANGFVISVLAVFVVSGAVSLAL
ncbi:MAG TPA: ABC transporter permease, partial [Rhodospirillales bacterium]|nr:ABC transporter permease [Rhodospirillales bacterium]